MRWLSPLVLSSLWSLNASAFTVSDFYPDGETPNPRQVRVQFSENMVAFGDPAGSKPPFASNTCAARGIGRWIDQTHWVFDFKKDLPAGVACAFKLDPALKALGGSGPEGQTAFGFNTGGPAIMESDPDDYRTPEDAAFVLTLNSDYDSGSILKHAYFQIPGVASKVPLKIIGGADRDAILKAYFRYREKATDEDLKKIVIVQSTLTFPAGKRVKLVFGPGVATKAGVARKTAQTREYHVDEPFKVTLNCERENAKAGCVPITQISVNFSREVAALLAKGIRLVGPKGELKPRPIKDSEFVYDVTFDPPFPGNNAFEVRLPDGFKDPAGVGPANVKQFPLKFKTAGAPPLTKFPGQFGILEAAHPLLPVTVRSVEAEIRARTYVPTPRADDKNFFVRWYDRLKGMIFRIPNGKTPEVLAWLDKVMRIDRDVSVFGPGQKDAEFDPKLALKDKAARLADLKVSRKDGKAFEVLGLDLKKPGFYVVETESKLLGKALLDADKTMYVATAALVTNLAVHFKKARASSVVWVTSLDKGAPVGGALISIWDCQKKLYFKGKANSDGYLIVDQELPETNKLPECFKGENSYPSNFGRGFFVVAEKGDDFSFTHSSWDGGIETWRFNLPYAGANNDVALHAVLDRSLLRAGDKINIKTLLRLRTAKGFAMAPAAKQPKQLELTHLGSDQKYTLPLQFDAAGVAVNDWQLPPDAKLGTYQITAQLPAAEGEVEDTWGSRLEAGEFRVEDFRIPLAKGLISSGAAVLVRPKAVKFDLGVQYLSGGSAGNQGVTFRAKATSRSAVAAPDFEDYVFATEPLKLGDAERNQVEAKPLELKQESITLGAGGTGSVSVDGLPVRAVPFDLESEMEYKDPSGEIQTVAKVQTIWPAPAVIGIKNSGGAVRKGQLTLKVAVVDVKGKGVKDKDVKIRLLKREYISHRKRLVGGFYAYDSVERLTLVKEGFCAGKTSAKGEFECAAKTAAKGELVAEASMADGSSTASTSLYVYGDDAEFAQEDGDRIDLVPEKKLYEPGEKAKIQVRMPFAKAHGLMVVEREGIQEVREFKLDGKQPTVEFDVKDEYAPNTYVSVMAVRGRLDKPAADFLVDLAKPAFRLGITPVKVGRKAYTLDVAVETEKKTYQARDEVKGTVAVKAALGKLDGDAEAAIAVIDEGLLQLKPNESWNLLEAMSGTRADTAQTFSSVLQVIGKRHFGMKAVSPGGGGGVEATRSMFDAMIYWEPRLRLDGSGKGTFQFKLNDSLTSFRVVAIAQAGAQRFGTGSTSIAATKDVMLLPGIPPTARGGDRFKASFTLRNTTKQAKDLTALLDVKGVKADLKPQPVKLLANAAQEVSWNVVVPGTMGELVYEASVKEGEKLLDRLVVKQKVKPAVPLRSNQATLVQLSPSTTLDLKQPDGAEKGRSRIVLSLSPTLAGDFDGIRRYMSDYPYACFEQRLSKAVALGDDGALENLLAALPSYLDEDGLVKYYPTSRYGSAVLTSYLIMVTHELGKELPAATKPRLAEALRAFLGGRLRNAGPSYAADLLMQKLVSIDALSRLGEATAELLDGFEHDASLWPTSALIDWIGILKRVEGADEGGKEFAKALKLLKSRMTYRGTAFGFSTDDKDSLWMLMVSADLNAVRALLLGLEFDLFGADTAKVVKGLLARQKNNGHWDLTNANALGVIALRKFAEKYEKTPVKGETVATLGKESRKLDWGKDEKGGKLDLAWPEAAPKLTVKQEGSGKPWAQIQSLAAVPLAAPVASGFQITKEVIPSRVKEPGKWHVGDVIKVKITVDAQADTGFVVVDDPIPTGSSVLGTGLGGNASEPASAGSETEADYWSWNWPVYRENTFEGTKTYYDFVSKGKFTVEYAFRLNNAGSFQLPPTHVEAMYQPDVYGDLPSAAWQVLD